MAISPSCDADPCSLKTLYLKTKYTSSLFHSQEVASFPCFSLYGRWSRSRLALLTHPLFWCSYGATSWPYEFPRLLGFLSWWVFISILYNYGIATPSSCSCSKYHILLTSCRYDVTSWPYESCRILSVQWFISQLFQKCCYFATVPLPDAATGMSRGRMATCISSQLLPFPRITSFISLR